MNSSRIISVMPAEPGYHAAIGPARMSEAAPHDIEWEPIVAWALVTDEGDEDDPYLVPLSLTSITWHDIDDLVHQPVRHHAFIGIRKPGESNAAFLTAAEEQHRDRRVAVARPEGASAGSCSDGEQT